MRNWKRILALGLGLTLTFGQAAYADTVISPLTTATEATTEGGTSSAPMTGVSGGTGTTGNSGSVVTAEAPGGASVNAGTVSVPGAVDSGSAAASEPGVTGQTTGTMTPTAATVTETTAATAGTTSAPAVTETTAATGTGTATTGTGTVATGTGTAAQAALTEPTVVSEGAVLMDANTGKVLFGKNQDQQFYPASITKVMTALVVLEHCNLNDTVTFSSTATTNLESGAVSLNIAEGDQLTVEQALYGLLLKSANEIGNGLAEHVAGSVSGFADMMNAKAKELGCKNTHFANPHGLNDANHKTTAYDMALILSAALKNSTFRKIDSTISYNFPATKNAAARTITMGHKMMYTTDSRYYEGIIGGKTGYTSKAGNTLVTGVERNGVRLVAVVLKSKGTHYTDTKAMLDYGFANYAALTGNSGSTAAGNTTVSAGTTAQGPSASQSTGTQTQAAVAQPAETQAAQSVTAQGPTAQTETAAETQSAANQTTANQTTASQTGTTTGWQQDSTGWYYGKSDGTRAMNEWIELKNMEYWFDGNGYMATGWRHFANGSWYYFAADDGHMVSKSWVNDSGYWYYLGDDGVLLTNTTTPDGCKVDENGIWIQ